ncbi:MAG: hypothetical protein ACK5P7_06015 [Bdellovibrio sp.]|jgi:hypothetical protein
MKQPLRPRFLILFISTLALFTGGGFYVGSEGLLDKLRQVRSHDVLILTENKNLFSPRLMNELQKQLPLQFKVVVASDPDTFVELAASADILWARKDWILKTELRLTDFKSNHQLDQRLARALSADFFSPTDTSSTLLPILWTLPVIRIKAKTINVPNLEALVKLPGEKSWPFWGIEDFFSGFRFPPPLPTPTQGPTWTLLPSSMIPIDLESRTDFWFPSQRIRPLVVCLSFVENGKLPLSIKEDMVIKLMEPRFIAKIATETGLATTIVQAEELLPPWQRASSLRKIGLNRLQKP